MHQSQSTSAHKCIPYNNWCVAKLYSDRLRFGSVMAKTWSKTQSGCEDRCYREKFRNIVAWSEPHPKTAFVRIFYGTIRLSCAQPTGNSFTPNQ